MEAIWKKITHKKTYKIVFLPKNYFIDKKYFLIYIKVYSDRSELDLSDATIRIQILISVESYDEKTVENNRNIYVAVEHIVSKLAKILILKFDSAN